MALRPRRQRSPLTTMQIMTGSVRGYTRVRQALTLQARLMPPSTGRVGAPHVPQNTLFSCHVKNAAACHKEVEEQQGGSYIGCALRAQACQHSTWPISARLEAGPAKEPKNS